MGFTDFRLRYDIVVFCMNRTLSKMTHKSEYCAWGLLEYEQHRKLLIMNTVSIKLDLRKTKLSQSTQ
jgi:hypothetical protein